VGDNTADGLIENSLFSKLNDLILHASRPVASTFLQSRGWRAIWQTAVRLPEAGNRHFDPFPWQILGHLDLSLADSRDSPNRWGTLACWQWEQVDPPQHGPEEAAR
jgi:hypothetical protein